MSRINDTLVVQRVDDDMVVMDTSSGAEIVFPIEDTSRVIIALTYLAGTGILEATP